MNIPVQQSVAGLIASDADVSFTEEGVTQVRFRVGEEPWRREQDGTFAKLESSFHDLLIFGSTAERAAARFRKGDQFVAHGYVDTRYAEPPSRPAEREVYVARKLGHDLARTAYDVDRTTAIARPTDQQLGQAEVLAVVGADNGQPSPGAAQNVPPPAPSGADRLASLRPGASPSHGIGL